MEIGMMAPRILVVDDSATIRMMLCEALEDDGYDVCMAANGQEALALIAAARPDVLLMDVDLPEMDGIDILLSLKTSEETRGISVIMTTAHERDDRVVGALEVGATDFIPKPFSEAIVRARVRNVIRIRNRNKRSDAATAAKTQFLANMSHEIRTPMTAILGFTGLLYSEGDITKAPPHRIAAIKTIKRNAEYLLELINDILDLSKVEAGKLEAERIRCSVIEVVADVISMMKVKADAKGISLEVEYAGPIPETIHTDPTRLRQILISLVSNAVKFTESGNVRVIVDLLDAECDVPKMQFEVVDSGIGMNDEQISRVFKPFNQAEAYTARKYGGTGLGLTISKHLAELLGGSIDVSSKLEQGSSFTVKVDIGSLEGVRLLRNLAESAQEIQCIEFDRSESQETLSCRVLLAEDGPDNQRLISYVLGKAGATVALADNGQMAVELALAAKADGNGCRCADRFTPGPQQAAPARAAVTPVDLQPTGRLRRCQ
jgi:signal transduction histidine kinase